MRPPHILTDALLRMAVGFRIDFIGKGRGSPIKLPTWQVAEKVVSSNRSSKAIHEITRSNSN